MSIDSVTISARAQTYNKALQGFEFLVDTLQHAV